MIINSTQIVSITAANQNFSTVAKLATDNQCAVILRNNKPKYILIDLDNVSSDYLELDIDARQLANLHLRKDSWV